jgi:ABC-type transport system substrate-binding protein
MGREFSPVPGEKRMEMNVSVFVPDGWGELLGQAMTAKDIETQEALTQELVRMLHDEAMIIPLWPNIFVYASDGSVQDTGLYETTWIFWTPENARLSQ